MVKVSYPLKQGLKLIDSMGRYQDAVVKVSYPLKQGLKHFLLNWFLAIPLFVKVSYPLKQGLKLRCI